MVAAYYHQVQSLHAAKVREELIGKEGLREGLASVVHVKLEILKDDRKFLGALFRYTGEPGQLVEWTNSAPVRPLLKPFQGKMLEVLREGGWCEEA